MAIDTEGYASLVSSDEEWAVTQLIHLRQELLGPLVRSHGGSVIDYAGDGALVVFDGPEPAIGFAIHLQRLMRSWQQDGKPVGWQHERDWRLRIGIDTGHVILTDSGIAGNHVNIAARLEGICEAGGICMTGRVHRCVARHLRNSYFGGFPKLKNIHERVDVYHWIEDEEDEEPAPHDLCRPFPSGIGACKAIEILPEPTAQIDRENLQPL